MVYDPSYRQVVLFGGCGSGCPLDGMYALNGNYQWNDCVNCGSQPFPSARWGASMAYDPADGYVLLFGGMGATGPLGDTWSFTLGPEPPCTVLIVARAFCAYLTEHNGTEQPSGRWGAAMDFDPNLGGILLFGGWAVTEGAISNEYGWEYSGGLWTTMTYPGLLSQYGAPPPAFGERLAYDSANGFVVEYGGCAPAVASGAVASCGPMADGYGVTWEYANGAWTALPPAAGSPGARWDEGLAYDAASNEVILFGGCRATDAICSGNASLLLGDTWSLTLGLLGTGSWSRVSSGGVGSPSPRGDLSMGYDSSDGVVVMFGGYGCSGGPGQVCGDTWTYGSGGWSPQSPSVKPVPRFGAEFAYDPETRGMVLVGGSTGGGLLSDVWSYNLTSGWVGEPAAPSPGYDGGVAFDPVLGGLVVFGGVGAGGTPTAQTAILGTFGGSSLRWVAAPTIITPTARWGMGMVDDASAGPMGYVVMVGGSVADNSSEPGPGGWSGAWGETWDFYGYLPLGGVEPQEPEYWLNLSEVT